METTSTPEEQITENKTADPKQENLAQIEIELIQALLAVWPQTDEGYALVENNRLYIKSSDSDASRFHMLSKLYNDLTIYQTIEGEKYQQSVTFSQDRILPLIAALLQGRMKEIQEQEKQKELYGDDALGDLDDHPF